MNSQRNKIRFSLYYDWEGIFAFNNDKRELINNIVSEIMKERKRISKLSWQKRLFNKLDK